MRQLMLDIFWIVLMCTAAYGAGVLIGRMM